MYKNKKILAIIPARGGSKGIPNKNIIDLMGKPLIWYTLTAAKNSKYIDEIIVSTDSTKIKETVEKLGYEVPFLRPAELASDTSKTIDAVIHTINTLKNMGKEYDYLILLQATSPLRTTDQVNNAIELLLDSKFNSLISISETDTNPLFIRKIGKDNILEKIINTSSAVRRQDLPKFYQINGSIYINKISNMSSNTSLNDNEIGFITSSETSLDIDDYDDLEKVKKILLKK